MKRRMVWFGIFLAGALMTGVGGGIAFGEYASLKYLGTENVGQEHMVTETLKTSRDPEMPFSVWINDWDRREVEFVTDSTLTDDVLIFEIEYNEQAVTPLLDRRREQVFEESGWEEEEPRMQEEFVLWSTVDGDFATLWNCKDEILEDLRQGAFHSYRIGYWGHVTVRMSEQAASMMEE
ncbi:MAG TPA: hypothetical protein IAA04_00690 [Candidatus Lachnoclostridium pullistercoris]|uniref:Uncharacterized protein n=1 Tax=Candidatus Lachnoclostridium pullistercoris TaxID=2838632 RepID=A0A9D2PC79_9FIRM|nr:hypothetical protein [Candidatus Lachnoclostridium pullistercoris]